MKAGTFTRLTLGGEELIVLVGENDRMEVHVKSATTPGLWYEMSADCVHCSCAAAQHDQTCHHVTNVGSALRKAAER